MENCPNNRIILFSIKRFFDSKKAVVLNGSSQMFTTGILYEFLVSLRVHTVPIIRPQCFIILSSEYCLVMVMILLCLLISLLYIGFPFLAILVILVLNLDCRSYFLSILGYDHHLLELYRVLSWLYAEFYLTHLLIMFFGYLVELVVLCGQLGKVHALNWIWYQILGCF